jgi:hypothetical protein
MPELMSIYTIECDGTALRGAVKVGNKRVVRTLLDGECVFYSNKMLIREGLGRTSLDIVIAQRQQGHLWVLLECGAAENRD